jgi:DnaJ-class molecular chaperone
MVELTKTCYRCSGTGKEVAGNGVESRLCPACRGLGKSLGDEVSMLICCLLDDEDIYRRILNVAEKLKSDIGKV